MTRVNISAMLLVAAVAWTASGADVWWVDGSHYGASGMTGASPAVAFGTIQEAVDAASSGDTVKVMPGVYDKGEGSFDGYMMSRVVVTNKTLTIESTGGKADTHIVGRYTVNDKYGEDSIRCIFAMPPPGGTVKFIGFTIRDGQARADSTNPEGVGGGLYAGNMNIRTFLIDCTVRHCRASRGAGMMGGVAVRTLFVGNRNLYAHGGIATGSGLFNCIATAGDLGGQPALQQCFSVNCTFIGNYHGSIATAGVMRNCVVLLNGDANGLQGLGTGSYLDLRHMVIDVPFAGTCDNMEGLAASVPSRQLFAPAFGDFRPVVGSVAATNGRADIMYEPVKVVGSSYAVMPDEEDRWLDFNGNAIPQSGSICAGALQEKAKAAGGAITFPAGTIEVCGMPTRVNGLHAFSATYPAQIHLMPDLFVGGTNIYSYWVVGGNSAANWRPAEMDDSFYVLPPPDPAAAMDVGIKAATATYYVNPAGSDTANDGLSAATPFKTLQKAADMAIAAQQTAVVHAAAGLYDEASQGTTAVGDGNGTHPTIVVVTNSNTFIRFKGAGRGLSIIEGRADKTVNFYNGCGPAAIRCVYFSNVGVVQGFSLLNGFSGYNGSTSGMLLSQGGSICGGKYTIGADCVISNSSAVRGCVNGGSYTRCAFYDCTGQNTGVRNAHFFTSCLFVNCAGTGAGSFVYNGDATALVQCSSYYGKTDQNTVSAVGYPAWNTAVSGGSSLGANNAASAGNVYDRFAAVTEALGFTHVDPQFASACDLRPFAGSPLLTAGTAPVGDYHLYATTDIDGLPLAFNADGVPIVGCHQGRAVSCAVIPPPTLGTVTPSGAVALADGESLTVTYTKDAGHAATRPYFGIAVNGETVTDGTTVTITAPAADEDPAAFRVEVLASTNWYVNATVQVDGDGFTPETAKKTLAGVMACDILAGDCIHVAPGDYKEGAMATPDLSGANIGVTSNRVTLISGVTLVGDEGPEKTIIRGRRGDNTTGRGPGALRCVYLPANATIRGFTLTDGTTATGGNESDGRDSSGGGVWAANAENARIYDCIITNCLAVRGGGGQSGRYVNCRFIKNSSGSLGDHLQLGEAYGCYLGSHTTSCGTKGTTVFSQCTLEDLKIGYAATGRTYSNLLVLGSACTLGNGANITFVNCFIEDRSSITSSLPSTTTFTDCRFLPASELQLDAAKRPIPGSCAALDAGDNAAVPAVLENRDALGIQRIYNGKVDVGAFEYDWRPVYAARLGGKTQVTAASPAVTNGAEAVCVPAGATLTLALRAEPGYAARYVAQTVGSGTLTVAQNGEALATLTAADGRAENRFTVQSDPVLTFAFAAGDGHGEVFAFSQRLGMLLKFR